MTMYGRDAVDEPIGTYLRRVIVYAAFSAAAVLTTGC